MIQSLRKEKGGYALLYVMVVVMVLCAISVMICTVALRNLQSQEASVRRMQDLYAAEGEIERIKAQIEIIHISDDNCSQLEEVAVRSLAKEQFEDKVKSIDHGATIIFKEGEDIATIVIQSQVNQTAVTANLTVAFNIHIELGAAAVAPETAGTPTKYSISTNSVTFASYTIENTGGGS